MGWVREELAQLPSAASAVRCHHSGSTSRMDGADSRKSSIGRFLRLSRGHDRTSGSSSYVGFRLSCIWRVSGATGLKGRDTTREELGDHEIRRELAARKLDVLRLGRPAEVSRAEGRVGIVDEGMAQALGRPSPSTRGHPPTHRVTQALARPLIKPARVWTPATSSGSCKVLAITKGVASGG